jgi:putative SOS response-associated peptidase YedK
MRRYSFEVWLGYTAEPDLETSDKPLTQVQFHISRIHPRMPVILHTRDYDRWLDREETDRLPLDLLRPYESEEMEVYEANPKVGNIRNNGPEMMRAAAKAAEDGELPL